MFTRSTFNSVSLDAAGLVALADLSTLAHRTALLGSASWLDILVLAPGIHKQQSASSVNNGEQPATAALTSGYVFRVENPATVYFLQRIGETGHLVDIEVKSAAVQPRRKRCWGCSYKLHLRRDDTGITAATSSLLYLLCPLVTITAVIALGVLHDWWGMGALLALAVARALNVAVFRRRTEGGWKGVQEGDEKGALLVLLSQDRWVRLSGLVTDLKAVTAGGWLRNASPVEGFFTAVATLIVFATAALAGNAHAIGSLVLLAVLLVEASLLGVSNSLAELFYMNGRVLKVVGEPKRYERRLDLALELIKETGRRDWAIGLGMIMPETETETVRRKRREGDEKGFEKPILL